jgi:hypothetical protein
LENSVHISSNFSLILAVTHVYVYRKFWSKYICYVASFHNGDDEDSGLLSLAKWLLAFRWTSAPSSSGSNSSKTLLGLQPGLQEDLNLQSLFPPLFFSCS